MTDLLAAEPLIIDRLKTITGVTGLKVSSTASIVGTVDITAQCPALFVHPGASEIGAEIQRGLAQSEEEEWEVVAAVKLIPDPSNLAKTYQSEAGSLLNKVVEKLVGWAPSSEFGAMRYAGRDKPEVMPGHAEFGLRFKVRRLIESAN